MLPFIEEPRFNTEVRYGTSGGPTFSTDVLTFSSGVEQRNSNWMDSLGKWKIGGDNYSKKEMDWLISFFRERQGRLGGFRFKDWSDYLVTTAQGSLIPIEGTTNYMQMVKLYDVGGGHTHERVIMKPVLDSVKVYKDGVLVTPIIDYALGWVKVAPEEGYTWSGEFDVPVRFGEDTFASNFEAYRHSDGESMFTVSGLTVQEIPLHDRDYTLVFADEVAEVLGPVVANPPPPTPVNPEPIPPTPGGISIDSGTPTPPPTDPVDPPDDGGDPPTGPEGELGPTISVLGVEMSYQQDLPFSLAGSTYGSGTGTGFPVTVQYGATYHLEEGHGLKVGDLVWRESMPEFRDELFDSSVIPFGPFSDTGTVPVSTDAPEYAEFYYTHKVRFVSGNRVVLVYERQYDEDEMLDEQYYRNHLGYSWQGASAQIATPTGVIRKLTGVQPAPSTPDPFYERDAYVPPMRVSYGPYWTGSKFVAIPINEDPNSTHYLSSVGGVSGWGSPSAIVPSLPNDIVYHDGSYVVVGGLGYFHRSVNNMASWSTEIINTFPVANVGGGMRFHTVKYLNGQFITLADKYMIILVSPTGAVGSWNEATDAFTAYGNNYFFSDIEWDGTNYILLGGDQGGVWVGPTLDTLAAKPYTPSQDVQFKGLSKVGVSGGRIVVAGSRRAAFMGASEPWIMTSTDHGETWTDVTPDSFASGTYTSVSLGTPVVCNGKWVIPGTNASYTSDNGVVWTEHPHRGRQRSGAVSSGSLMLASDNRFLVYSTDGITWTQCSTN